MLPTVHFPSNYFLHFPPFCAQPNEQDENGPTAKLHSSAPRYRLVCWPCHGSGGYSPAFRREGPGTFLAQYVRFMVDRQSRGWFMCENSRFPFQYHSTIAPYSFIHLPLTLYNVFLSALQFSPVSIIPPLLHTHSSIYHSQCIMFFSQYFSFPLSVSFHHCSILIHSSTTHAV